MFIHELSLDSFDGGHVRVHVRCSKGTYLRTLAEDVGKALGCGAHVSILRRLRVGPFAEHEMLTLDAVEAAAEQGFDALDALLLPMERAVHTLPTVNLDARSAYYLRQGQAVLTPHAPTDGVVRMYAEDGSFVGIGEVLDDGRVAPRRLLAAR